MLPTEPESTSELVRARHIVATTLLEVNTPGGAWEPAGDMLVARNLGLVLRLERVLKGDLEVLPPWTFQVKVRVFKNVGPRIVAVPGVWSKQALEPGARHVVFSTSASTHPVEALDEAALLKVEAAEKALPDVEAVLRVEAPEPRLRLPQAVAALSERRASFTYLVARYVAWRLRELFFGDLAGFDAVLREAERPETAAIFRQLVFVEAYDDLMMLDPAPPRFVARLIWGSLRIIAAGPGAALAGRVVGTYIPNLVGLEGGLEPKHAAAVFHDDEHLRREVEDILRTRPDLPGGDRLLAWLGS